MGQPRYTLLGPDGVAYRSATPGTLGGHRRGRLYGRPECPSALRAIARGHYVRHRVFFADEATARAAGYRPCAVCLPEQFSAWKARRGCNRDDRDGVLQDEPENPSGGATLMSTISATITTAATTIRSTPVGPLTLTASDEGITRVAFGAAPADPAPSARAGQWLEQATRELDEYFAGSRTAFTVPVDLRGLGAGQRAALDLLGAVDHGETTTYGRLSAQLAGRGGPGSESWSSHVGPRRVGAAMARNPVPILLPCHRVVGSNGELTGYAGGLEIKRRLLELESPQGMLGSA